MSYRIDKLKHAIVFDKTTGAVAEYKDNVEVFSIPDVDTSALVAAKRGYFGYLGAGNGAGGHHGIGVIGEYELLAGKNPLLGIATEGALRISHASGVLDDGFVVVAHYNGNIGHGKNIVLFQATASNHTGLTDTLTGFNFEDLSTLGGTVTSKQCFNNQDPGAVLLNSGITYLEQPMHLGTFTVLTAPSAVAYNGYEIFVSDGRSGAPTTAYSDGTDWLHSTTVAAIAAA